MARRRELLRDIFPLTGGAVVGPLCAMRPSMPTTLQPNRLSRVSRELLHEIVVLPVDDVHCHAIPRPHPALPADVPLTAEDFLELLSLSAFPLYKYFPPDVYLRWFRGDADTRSLSDLG